MIGRCRLNAGQRTAPPDMLLAFRSLKKLRSTSADAEPFAEYIEAIVEAKVLEFKDPYFLGEVLHLFRDNPKIVSVISSRSPQTLEQLLFPHLRQLLSQQRNEEFIRSALFAVKNFNSGGTSRTFSNEEVAKLLTRFLASTPSPALNRLGFPIFNLIGIFHKFSVFHEALVPSHSVLAELSHHFWRYYVSFWTPRSSSDETRSDVSHAARCIGAVFVLQHCNDESISSAASKELEVQLSCDNIKKLDLTWQVEIGLLLRALASLPFFNGSLPGRSVGISLLPFLQLLATSSPGIIVENWAAVNVIISDLFVEKFSEEAASFFLPLWNTALELNNFEAACSLFDFSILDKVAEADCGKVLENLGGHLSPFFLKRLSKSSRLAIFLSHVPNRFTALKPLVMKGITSIVAQIFEGKTKEPRKRYRFLLSLARDFSEVPKEAVDKVSSLASSTSSLTPGAIEDAFVFIERFAETESQLSAGRILLCFLCRRRWEWTSTFALVAALRFASHNKMVQELSQLMDWIEESKIAVSSSFTAVAKLLRGLRDSWNTERSSRRLSGVLTRAALQGATKRPLSLPSFSLVAVVAEVGVPRDTVDHEIASYAAALQSENVPPQMVQDMADVIKRAIWNIMQQREDERRRASLIRSVPLVRYLTHTIMAQNHFNDLPAPLISQLCEMVIKMIGEVDFPGSILFIDRCIGVLASMPSPPEVTPPTTALKHFAPLHVNALRHVRHMSVSSRVLITEAIALIDLTASDDHLSQLVSVVSMGQSLCAT
jgi:hypothetical protein